MTEEHYLAATVYISRSPLLLLLLLPPARPVPISIDHPSPHSIPPHPHAFFLTINKPRTILEMPISLIDNIFPIRSSMIAPFGETVKASCRDILCFNLTNHSSLALKLSILVLMSLKILFCTTQHHKALSASHRELQMMSLGNCP